MELPPPSQQGLQVDCWFTAQNGEQFRRYHSDDDDESCSSGDEWGSTAGDGPEAAHFERPRVFTPPTRLILAEGLAMECDSASSSDSIGGSGSGAQQVLMSYDSQPLHAHTASGSARQEPSAARLRSTGSTDSALDAMDAAARSGSPALAGTATPRLRHAFSIGDRLGSIEVSVADGAVSSGEFWRDGAMGPLRSGLAPSRAAAAQRLHSAAAQHSSAGLRSVASQVLVTSSLQQEQQQQPSHHHHQHLHPLQPPVHQQQQQQQQRQHVNSPRSPQTPAVLGRPPRIVPPPTSASWHDLSDAAAAGPLTTTTHGELPRLPRALSFLSIEDVDLDIADDLTPDAFRSGRSGFGRDQDLRRTALINRSGHLLGSPNNAQAATPRQQNPQSPGGNGSGSGGAGSPCTPRGSIMGQAQHAFQHPGAPRRQPLAPSPLSPQHQGGQTARVQLQALREAWPELSDSAGAGRNGLSFAQELEHIRGLMPHRFREVAEMAHTEGWSLGLLGGNAGNNNSNNSSSRGNIAGLGDAGGVAGMTQLPVQQRAGTSSGAASPSSSNGSSGGSSRGRLSPGIHCYQGGSSPLTPQQEPVPPHQQRQLRPPLHHPHQPHQPHQPRSHHHQARGQPLPPHDERHGGELCPGCGAPPASSAWGSVLGHDAGYSRRHDQAVQAALPPPALSGAGAAAGAVAAAAAAAARQRRSYFDERIVQQEGQAQQQQQQQQQAPPRPLDWRQCAERLLAEEQQQLRVAQQQQGQTWRGTTASAVLGGMARGPGVARAAMTKHHERGVRGQGSVRMLTPLQAVLADASFLGALLTSLPGVDAAAPVVKQALAGLRGESGQVPGCNCGVCAGASGPAL